VSINLASVFFDHSTNKVHVECQTKNTRQINYLSVFSTLGKKVYLPSVFSDTRQRASLPSVFSDTRQRASLPSVKNTRQRDYLPSIFLTQDKVNFQITFSSYKLIQMKKNSTTKLHNSSRCIISVFVISSYDKSKVNLFIKLISLL
jgi:hypothetical protein